MPEDKFPYATVAEAAEAFERACIPDAASHDQTVAMLQAFHAGAAAMLVLVHSAATGGGTPEARAKRLNDLSDELNAFADATLVTARLRGRA